MAALEDDLAALQAELTQAIAAEDFERCGPIRDQIKKVQAAISSRAISKAESLADLESQLAQAVQQHNFDLCIALRDRIKVLKCSCGGVYDEETVCEKCGSRRSEQPPEPVARAAATAGTDGRSTVIGLPRIPDPSPRKAPLKRQESSPTFSELTSPTNKDDQHKDDPISPTDAGKPPPRGSKPQGAPGRVPAESKKDPESKGPEVLQHKVPPLAPGRGLSPSPPSVHTRGTSSGGAERGPPIRSASTLPMINSQPPPALAAPAAPTERAATLPVRLSPVTPLLHSPQECEEQLWTLLLTLDTETNYGIALKYHQDRGRGAFFLAFRDLTSLFSANRATFVYQTQSGLTAAGVFGTEMAEAVRTYDPATQFIGCVLLKDIACPIPPLLLCNLFGETETKAAPVQTRESVGLSLQKKLDARPSPDEIRKSSIMPSAEEVRRSQEAKKTVWNALSGFFRWRPKIADLEKMNIMKAPACFGVSLDKVYEKNNIGDGVLIPNIVRKLVGQLRRHDVATLVGLFRLNGDMKEIADLKRQFDYPEPPVSVQGTIDCPVCHAAFVTPADMKAHATKEHPEGEKYIPGPDISKSDPHALAGLLKMFFRELPEPLFPFDSYLPITEAATGNNLDRVPQMIKMQFPPINMATWNFILEFFVEVCFHQKTNMMPPRNVGIVIAPNVLRIPPKHDSIARFAKDTPVTVSVIEFLIEKRAKELGMVAKGVPPPKQPVLTDKALGTLLSLPPLVPLVVTTAEVQPMVPTPQGSPAPSPPPLPSAPPPLTIAPTPGSTVSSPAGIPAPGRAAMAKTVEELKNRNAKSFPPPLPVTPPAEIKSVVEKAGEAKEGSDETRTSRRDSLPNIAAPPPNLKAPLRPLEKSASTASLEKSTSNSNLGAIKPPAFPKNLTMTAPLRAQTAPAPKPAAAAAKPESEPDTSANKADPSVSSSGPRRPPPLPPPRDKT